MSAEPSDPQLPVRLENLRTIRIAGEDRIEFLQGQLTQDASRLAGGGSLLAGWASAKGRLLLITQLAEWDDAVWMTVPAPLADSLAMRLRMFVLRAAVNVDVPTVNLFGLTADTAIPAAAADCGIPPSGSDDAVADSASCLMRVHGDPSRIIMITHADVASQTADRGLQQWELADIRAGLPSISPETSESFVPQMVNLDLLDGISFTKGCYVGQEIVARTQNLGRIKRRMIGLAGARTRMLAPGDPIYSDPDTVCGRVVRAAISDERIELLAVVPLDAIGTPMFADTSLMQPLTETELPYPLRQP